MQGEIEKAVSNARAEQELVLQDAEKKLMGNKTPF